jgi:hypothetical protein
MGLYDNIKCLYPLPDNPPENIKKQALEGNFQTKDLECFLEDYTITEEGELIHHAVRYDFVPEEERPYYGKPEWITKPFTRSFGSMKTTFTGDEKEKGTFALNFYTTNAETDEWYEYVALFKGGKLIAIERTENKEIKKWE